MTNQIGMRKLGLGGPSVFPIALGCMGMSGMYGYSDENESISTIVCLADKEINGKCGIIFVIADI
jgi:hypothetical protein